MNIRSKAIILNTIKYGDGSLISKAYTEEHGLISTISSSRRNKKSSLRNYFQALNMVEISYHFKASNNLHRIKEISLEKNSISDYNVSKDALRYFLAEVLYKVIREEEKNPPLFNFLWNELSRLSEMNEGFANYHLLFLHELSGYLGIMPDLTTSGDYFDYREGYFTSSKPEHEDFCYGHIKESLDLVLSENKSTKTSRKQILDFYLTYYSHQLSGIGKIKSLEVLETVFA